MRNAEIINLNMYSWSFTRVTGRSLVFSCCFLTRLLLFNRRKSIIILRPKCLPSLNWNDFTCCSHVSIQLCLWDRFLFLCSPRKKSVKKVSCLLSLVIRFCDSLSNRSFLQFFHRAFKLLKWFLNDGPFAVYFVVEPIVKFVLGNLVLLLGCFRIRHLL